MTNTPCQTKSGSALMATASGEAVTCAKKREGTVILFVGQSIETEPLPPEADWVGERHAMENTYKSLVALNIPIRVTILHVPKGSTLPYGIDPLFATAHETVHERLMPTPNNWSGGETDQHPWNFADSAWINWWPIGHVVGQDPGGTPGITFDTQKCEPMIPVDENRLPEHLWHNVDPQFREQGQEIPAVQTRGRRGFSPFQNEYETQIEAFHADHGFYPANLIVVSDEQVEARYGYDLDINPLGDDDLGPGIGNVRWRKGVGSLGLGELANHHGIGDWYFDSDFNSWVHTHLTHRTALGDAMRNIRNKYGITTELHEYGEYPTEFQQRVSGKISHGRLYRELNQRLKYVRDLDGSLPGSPEWFPHPWPAPGGTP